MSVILGRAGLRSVVPKQKMEVILTIFAEQSLKNVEIHEEILEGFKFVTYPNKKTHTFTKQEFPELTFIPRGHTRSISYFVDVDIAPNTFYEQFPNGFGKIRIKGKAQAQTLNNMNVKSHSKTSTYAVVAPFVIIDAIEVLNDGDLALIVKNIGNIDAKEVTISISFLIDLIKRKVQSMKIEIVNKDNYSNRYKVGREFSETEMFDELKIDKKFSELLINFIQKKDEKEISSDFKQNNPIPLEADRRNRLICVKPIAR